MQPSEWLSSNSIDDKPYSEVVNPTVKWHGFVSPNPTEAYIEYVQVCGSKAYQSHPVKWLGLVIPNPTKSIQ